jgi:hypothetical protein
MDIGTRRILHFNVTSHPTGGMDSAAVSRSHSQRVGRKNLVGVEYLSTSIGYVMGLISTNETENSPCIL